ncbi:MAG: Na-translocating system protein MpsC family protein [Bacillota bacterium]
MFKRKIALEKEVKKIMTKIHQDIFGKGPDELWVKINNKVGSFYCSKTLTTMEEFLLSLPGGEEEVLRLRTTILKAIVSRLCSEIELMCSAKVLSVSAELCTQSNVFFGSILFQEDFDK